jgi:hypothetical protein
MVVSRLPASLSNTAVIWKPDGCFADSETSRRLQARLQRYVSSVIGRAFSLRIQGLLFLQTATDVYLIYRSGFLLRLIACFSSELTYDQDTSMGCAQFHAFMVKIEDELTKACSTQISASNKYYLATVVF